MVYHRNVKTNVIFSRKDCDYIFDVELVRFGGFFRIDDKPYHNRCFRGNLLADVSS